MNSQDMPLVQVSMLSGFKRLSLLYHSATVQQNSIIQPCCLRRAKVSTLNLVHFLLHELADLDGLSKLTDTLHEKLLSSGVNAIPLDSEMLQLDYQATVRKGQEEAELSRITMQRVQTNCATLRKAMSVPRK